MSKHSFNYCPICGEPLEYGKLILPYGNSVTGYVWWHSEKKIIVRSLNDCIGLFRTMPKDIDKKTFNKFDIPSGFCKKCDKIFAEFEVVDWENSRWRR